MEDLLKQQFIIVQRVYQTLLIGVLAYGVIAYWMVKSDSSSSVGGGTHTLKYILFFVSMACVMIIPKFKEVFLKMKPEDEPTSENLINKLYKMQMFSLGMCEIPAFIGMVIAVLSKNMSIFFIFLAISYAGLYRYRPQWEQWKEYAQKMSFI